MNRHYYISNNIDELETVEHELESEGLSRPQIHVLSDNMREVELHDVNGVTSIMRRDVLRCGLIGFAVGILVAAAIVAVVHLSGIAEATTWVPFVFLAIAALGFCTWEGGLFGIEVSNMDVRRFKNALKRGYHVLFVDTTPQQEAQLERVLSHHPHLRPAGVSDAGTDAAIGVQKGWQRFIRFMP